ncbi:hypothetical protein NLU13_0401 [Sarocladium strictum]|uniref:Uncharacterized protein n=1 Tax=Sarocladium strictum TaxID=5046 RepID=A0AA39GQG4_SARSR|nr:hypothetical protein NLU13_0401 [Sarocladium strictum]
MLGESSALLSLAASLPHRRPCPIPTVTRCTLTSSLIPQQLSNCSSTTVTTGARAYGSCSCPNSHPLSSACCFNERLSVQHAWPRIISQDFICRRPVSLMDSTTLLLSVLTYGVVTNGLGVNTVLTSTCKGQATTHGRGYSVPDDDAIDEIVKVSAMSS